MGTVYINGQLCPSTWDDDSIASLFHHEAKKHVSYDQIPLVKVVRLMHYLAPDDKVVAIYDKDIVDWLTIWYGEPEARHKRKINSCQYEWKQYSDKNGNDANLLWPAGWWSKVDKDVGEAKFILVPSESKEGFAPKMFPEAIPNGNWRWNDDSHTRLFGQYDLRIEMPWVRDTGAVLYKDGYALTKRNSVWYTIKKWDDSTFTEKDLKKLMREAKKGNLTEDFDVSGDYDTLEMFLEGITCVNPFVSNKYDRCHEPEAIFRTWANILNEMETEEEVAELLTSEMLTRKAYVLETAL